MSAVAATGPLDARLREEGAVMATTLSYVIGDLQTSRRAAILDDFRSSGKIRDLFERGLREVAALLPNVQWREVDHLQRAPKSAEPSRTIVLPSSTAIS